MKHKLQGNKWKDHTEERRSPQQGRQWFAKLNHFTNQFHKSSGNIVWTSTSIGWYSKFPALELTDHLDRFSTTVLSRPKLYSMQVICVSITFICSHSVTHFEDWILGLGISCLTSIFYQFCRDNDVQTPKIFAHLFSMSVLPKCTAIPTFTLLVDLGSISGCQADATDPSDW